MVAASYACLIEPTTAFMWIEATEFNWSKKEVSQDSRDTAAKVVHVDVDVDRLRDIQSVC
jgi:hypothetical protein